MQPRHNFGKIQASKSQFNHSRVRFNDRNTGISLRQGEDMISQAQAEDGRDGLIPGDIPFDAGGETICFTLRVDAAVQADPFFYQARVAALRSDHFQIDRGFGRTDSLRQGPIYPGEG